MLILAEKTFLKDVEKIRVKSVLLKLQEIIESIRRAETLDEISDVKKLTGSKNYFRLRFGNYRIGFKFQNKEIKLIRILHRKEIYSYFP